eukprot:m.455985 g.455985  ORF g.455985 m.455985 type:complete len:532 (+) comp20970_c0_seq1:106-1701(+)
MLSTASLRGVLVGLMGMLSVCSFGWIAGTVVVGALTITVTWISRAALKVDTAKCPPPHCTSPSTIATGSMPTNTLDSDDAVVVTPTIRVLGDGTMTPPDEPDAYIGEARSGVVRLPVVGETVQGTPVYARRVGEVLKPKYTLTPENEKALLELADALSDLGPKEAAFCDRACLCRYLRARDWKVLAAEKLLRETLQWREEYGIENVGIESIKDELATGKIYIHGFDRSGQPVMYQKPRNENSQNYENQVKAVAYLLEREMCAMDLSAGIEKHTLVIDFKGYSIFNKPPMSVTKQVLSLLMDKYPERLGVAFLVDAPVLFQGLWRVVKPFLPAETKKKIFFVSRTGTFGKNGKMAEKFAEYFDDDQLEDDFGGTLPSRWGWTEFVESEQAMSQPKKAWYACGAGVKVNEAWNSNGYTPMEKETEEFPEMKSLGTDVDETPKSTGKLRGMCIGGVPIESRLTMTQSPVSPARKGIALVSPATSPTSHLRVSPLRVSRSVGRKGRVPSIRRPHLSRANSQSSVRSTASSASVIL